MAKDKPAITIAPLIHEPSQNEIKDFLKQAFTEVDAILPDDFVPGVPTSPEDWTPCHCDYDREWLPSGSYFSFCLKDGGNCGIIVENKRLKKFASRLFGLENLKPSVRKAIAAQLDYQIQYHKELTKIRWQDAAKSAAAAFDAATDSYPSMGTSQSDAAACYLTGKGITALFGARVSAIGALVIPLYDTTGKICAVQTIDTPECDHKGKLVKQVTRGSRLSGLFFELDTNASPDTTIYIAEGFATIATIVMATGSHGVMAISCHNLEAVAGKIKAKYPKRKIVICGDNDCQWKHPENHDNPKREGRDNVGQWHAINAARSADCYYAVCPSVDGKSTDYNDLYISAGKGEAGLEAVRKALANPVRAMGCPTPKGYYALEKDNGKLASGLYKIGADGAFVRIAPFTEILARARREDERGYSLYLRWIDEDGQERKSSIPYTQFVRNGTEWYKTLADAGYRYEDSSVADDLQLFFERSRPPRKMLILEQIGWTRDGSCFALRGPAGSIVLLGSPADGSTVDDYIFDQRAAALPPFDTAGTLADWQSTIAALAIGNPTLTFSIATAFVGPLLMPTDSQGIVYNWIGESSAGKTTHLLMALSVWDGKATGLLSCDATACALEGAAVARNDTFLATDETGQGQAKMLKATAYKLGNGAGRNRADKTGQLRQAARFRIAGGSTGEHSLEDLLTEAGLSYDAGIEVRNIPLRLTAADCRVRPMVTDPQTGQSRMMSTKEFADKLNENARFAHGTAGPEFVARLIPHLASNSPEDPIKQALSSRTIKAIAIALLRDAGVDELSGAAQLARSADAFALVETAGTIAQALDILPADMDIHGACVAMLSRWIDARGTTIDLSRRDAVRDTINFLQTRGADCFFDLDAQREYDASLLDTDGAGRPLRHLPQPQIPRTMLGYRHIEGGKMIFEAFREPAAREIWHKTGADLWPILQALEDKQILAITPSGQGSHRWRVSATDYKHFRGDRYWAYRLTIPGDSGLPTEQTAETDPKSDPN